MLHCGQKPGGVVGLGLGTGWSRAGTQHAVPPLLPPGCPSYHHVTSGHSARFQEELVSQSGLAVVDVGDNREVADALHRHLQSNKSPLSPRNQQVIAGISPGVAQRSLQAQCAAIRAPRGPPGRSFEGSIHVLKENVP